MCLILQNPFLLVLPGVPFLIKVEGLSFPLLPLQAQYTLQLLKLPAQLPGLIPVTLLHPLWLMGFLTQLHVLAELGVVTELGLLSHLSLMAELGLLTQLYFLSDLGLVAKVSLLPELGFLADLGLRSDLRVLTHLDVLLHMGILSVLHIAPLSFFTLLPLLSLSFLPLGFSFIALQAEQGVGCGGERVGGRLSWVSRAVDSSPRWQQPCCS